jgi:carboxyl-terminal processing protease
VQVKNVGKGTGLSTSALLRSASGDLVGVNKGRFEMQKMAPGETRMLEFTFDLRKEFRDQDGRMQPFTDKEAVVELSVYDTDLREGVTEKLRFPLYEGAAAPVAAHGEVKAKKDLEVHEGAADDAPVLGTIKKGAVLNETGTAGQWVRVEIEQGRPGFVAASSVAQGGGAATTGAFTQTWQVTPPLIAVASSSLETTGDRWTLTGTATDDTHVEDVYVLVSNRDSKIEGKKVFYLSNRGKKAQNKLDFSAVVPVWPGNNMVTVVARENNEVRAIHTVFVLRTDRVATANVTPTPPK